MQSYKDLQIYKVSHRLAVEIHKMTLKDLPKFEMYEEAAQIRKSSKSIPSVIVGSAPQELEFVPAVYAIKSLKTGRIYIGQTQNADKRLQYHNSGYVKSTCDDRPWQLYALQKVKSINEARWLERKLKRSQGMRLRWLEKNGIQ